MVRKVSKSKQEQEETAGQGKKKNEAIDLRHLRLRVRDIQMTDALYDQRGTPWPDLSRRIYERGCLIEAACGAPDLQGNYGIYTGARLAQLLATDVETLITFQMRHGQVPTILQVLLDLVQKQGTVPAPIAAMQAEGASVRAAAGSEALTEVDAGAVETLDLFFHEKQS